MQRVYIMLFNGWGLKVISNFHGCGEEVLNLAIEKKEIMTSIAIRQKVQQYIDNADDAVIKALFSILKKVSKNEKQDLKQLTIEEYNKSLDLAEKEIADGKYLTHREAVKKIRNW